MDPTTQAQVQDALRPIRQFVNLLGAASGDQSWAGTDGYALNYPYQYQVAGPYGYGVEGAPISTTRGGGIVISPAIVLIGLGVAAAMIWKR